MYPLTAYFPIGEDCSALPGVADVSCLGGECVVHRCLPGYVPVFGGTSCIRKHFLQSPSEFVHGRTYLRRSMDSNTFPSEETKFRGLRYRFLSLDTILDFQTYGITDNHFLYSTALYLTFGTVVRPNLITYCTTCRK